MAEHSTIEWTDATWNPITGCTIVDAGCTNCYAMALAGSRLRNHPSRAGLTRVTGGRSKWTGEVRLNEQWMDQPLRWSRPRRIFVCAHGDLFHEAVPDEWIDRVFAVMALAPQHTFQVLTKRPERAREYLLAQLVYEGRGVMSRGNIIANAALGMDTARFMANGKMLAGWPLPNVWLGTSASDQASADLRIPHLLAAPAAVRFLSAEPLLGPVDLTRIRVIRDGYATERFDALNIVGQRSMTWWKGEQISPETPHRCLDLVIVGGESGPGARPMHPDWARSLRDQCVAAGVAFHFKQSGEYAWSEQVEGLPTSLTAYRVGKKAAGRLLDGRTWDQMPEVRHD